MVKGTRLPDRDDPVALNAAGCRLSDPKTCDSPQVLWWGILSAAVLRLLFIAAGAAALEYFSPVILVFAAILLYSSYKILALGDDDDEDEDLADNAVVKLCRQDFPLGFGGRCTHQHDGICVSRRKSEICVNSLFDYGIVRGTVQQAEILDICAP
jgi:predicted tellurium resistance membrane protein TerC